MTAMASRAPLLASPLLLLAILLGCDGGKKTTAVVSGPSEAPFLGSPCTPVEYACASDNAGWFVCNAQGVWVRQGECPPNTSCVFWEPSQTPYCVPLDFGDGAIRSGEIDARPDGAPESAPN